MVDLQVFSRGFATPHPYVDTPLTDTDLKVATLGFGWTLGFGFFVVWHAIQQTTKMSVYITLVWLEILASTIFAVIVWLYLIVQLLLQIIVNRICLLWPNKTQKWQLKLAIAVIISAINIVVYCIWIPARLQISERYILINNWWDRTEKCIYLAVDAFLNWLFIYTVNARLVSRGLQQYKKLVDFNIRLIFISMSMDVLIVGMMSYKNSFVYMQFHPVAYLVKLNIEMSLSSLIVDIASAKRLPRVPPLLGTPRALQIAVHRVQQSSISRPECGGDDEKLRTTRTPRRPDLAHRLSKMRREKLEREAPGDLGVLEYEGREGEGGRDRLTRNEIGGYALDGFFEEEKAPSTGLGFAEV